MKRSLVKDGIPSCQHRKTLLWWSLLVFLTAPVSRAQYQIDNWTTDNGLPQNVIRDVCQLPDGFLWLATMDGLVRFDGVNFTVFNRSNTPGIAGNRFNSLYCTETGELWAGTETNGVTRYRQGRFITYTLQHGLPLNQVLEVTGDKTGRIWALSQGSIFRWDENTSTFTQVSTRSKGAFLPNGSFGFLAVDKDGVYLFSQGQELQYPLPLGWPRQGLVRACQDLNGIIWLASADGRFAKLRGGRWSKIFRPGTKQAGLDALTSPYRDARGNVWQMGIASGVGNNLITYFDLSSRTQKQRIAFNSFFQDREGGVWLSTDGQGLYRIRKARVSSFSKEDGLPDRNIYPIFQDHAGAIWIGTWNGGLVRFKDGKLTTFSTANGLASNRVNSIGQDRDGVLWVSTSPGLQTIRNGRIEPVQSGASLILDDVRAIDQDRDGTMLLGTSQGLLRYKDHKWSVLTTKDGLVSNDVRVMIDGRMGNIWMGGYGGLTSFFRGQFKHWTEADGLPSNSIRSLYEDHDGVLWIGTYDAGLGRLENGRLTRYTMDDGLFNNGVFQILEDSRGHLWMSCNRGIYRLAKSELNAFARGESHVISSVVYGKRDGMRNAECNGGLSPAGIRARDGKLWFPTQDGVVIIDPDQVEENLTAPAVVIESASVDREPMKLNSAIRIQPGRENLEIDYAAPSLADPNQIEYKYRLENLDRDWVEAGARRTAYYSHLPPGKYTFRVIAANSDGAWNTEGKSLPITVLPKLYQTWWFTAVTFAAVVGTVSLAWLYWLSKLRREQAAQQVFSRQLIESQENERKRIAAELHDSLGQRLIIIKNLALLLLQSRVGTPELAAPQRKRVEGISAEVSEALREVKEISYDLRPYRLDRLGLTATLQVMIEMASEASSIRFSSEIDNVDTVFAKSAEINFYRVVQECVNNVLKHSQAAHASVCIRHSNQRVMVTVQDDGRGFAPDFGNLNSPLGGFGLTGVSERAQLLGGKATIQSAPARGTTVVVEINLER